MNPKEILRETYYRETGTYPREGSAVTNLVLNPFSLLLTPYNTDLALLKQQMLLVEHLSGNVNNITPAIIDALAANFFTTRVMGSKVSGPVVLVFASRVNISIPQNTIVITGSGKKYLVNRDYFFAGQQLIENAAGEFETPNITVIAEKEGDDYRISAGEIVNINLSLTGLVDITNPQDFTGGKKQETNAELIARIIDGYSTRGLDMLPGINYRLLTDQVNIIESLVVIGSGDPEMIRDRVYEATYNGGVPYILGDFTHKKVGSLSVPHLAYKKLGTNVTPDPDDFTTELTQTEYGTIETTGDTSLEVTSGLIFSDDFNRTDDLGAPITLNSLGNGWKVGETGDTLHQGGMSSISVGEGELRLGNISGESFPSTVEAPENLLQYGSSPVVQHRLTSTKGIRISGTFETDDIRRAPSFITIAKKSNATTARAFEGFGLAWMISDVVGRPNLYIVDNAALDNRMVVAGTEIFNSKRVENFLAAATKQINSDTEYNFEIIYNLPADGNEAIACEVRIWEVGDSRPVSADISYGAYTPLNKRALDLEGNAQSVDAMDLGIGVLNGGESVWIYKDLEVVGIAEQYSQLLLKMDVSGFSADPDITATLHTVYRGSGSSSGVETDGAAVKVYNHTTENWETLHQNDTGSLYSFLSTVNLTAANHIRTNQVTLLLTSKYKHDASTVTPIFSKLFVDYFGLRQFAAYKNVGGKIDVYVKTWPNANYNNLIEDSVDIASAPAILALTAANGFTLPIGRITTIDVLASGTPTGTQLEENVEYRTVVADPGLRGSANENLAVIFDSSVQGYELRVNYEYFDHIPTLQSYVSGDAVRKMDNSLLVKHLLPFFVEINLTTNFTSAAMVDAVKKLVWESAVKLEVSDIFNVVYQEGATYIDLDLVNISSFFYDDDGNRIEATHTNTIEIDRTRFFLPLSVTINTA